VIAVVATVMFGASAYAAIGDALASYSPGPLALLRMLVASVMFAVFAAFAGVRLPEVRDLPAAVLAGLLAFALGLQGASSAGGDPPRTKKLKAGR